MKSYTDIEQSKELTQILPHESADMYYHPYPNDEDWYDIPNIGNADLRYNQLPCWSLSALLELFDDKAGLARDYGWWFCYDNGKSHCTKHYENPIDAAFEMVCWMKENKKI